VTLTHTLTKEDGLIDWTRPAREIHNCVRGFQPWPGAWTHFRAQPLHIWKSRVAEDAVPLAPGRLARRGGLFAGCGNATVLELLEVQMEGRKRIAAGDFANGQRISGSDVLD
jgi:methionyl-tRNA formyltransferase